MQNARSGFLRMATWLSRPYRQPPPQERFLCSSAGPHVMPIHSVFWVAWDLNGVSRNTKTLFDISVRLIHFLLGHPDGEWVSCLELSLTYSLLILIDTCSLAILYYYVDCPKNPDTQLVRRFGGCCLGSSSTTGGSSYSVTGSQPSSGANSGHCFRK